MSPKSPKSSKSSKSSKSTVMSSRDNIRAMVKNLGVTHITDYDDKEINSARIENCIGFTKVPVGIAGPLLVHSPDGRRREVYAPLATTEAAMIASCSRGCKALTLGGGVHYAVLSEGMVRAPLFKFDDPSGALAFRQAWPTIEPEFRRWANATSQYARLQSTTVHLSGSEAHVMCKFACGAAAGQNMVTKACDVASKQLMASAWARPLGIRFFLVDGDMASDKKASWGNVMRHRGTEVHVWGRVPDDVCRRVLGSPAETLFDIHHTAVHSSVRDGHFGSNIDTANVLAAMFIALGQDAGSVAEASWCHLRVDLDRDSQALTYSMYCPSLPVGTIGGGTTYPCQKEAMRILGCTEPEDKGAMAALIACFAMALDMSTMAAMANGTFSQAHMVLARGEEAMVKAKL